MHFISFILLMSSLNVQAATDNKLPELMTKQSLNNIRYLSKNGKITYYQNNSGELKFSSNYQVKTVKKSQEKTQFLVTSSNDEMWVGIEEIADPHRPISGVILNTLSVGKLSEERVQVVDKGANLQFQLKNRFITYFNPRSRKISIKNLSDLSQTRTVQIFDKNNTLFVPQAFLSTENDLIFTDINSKGHAAVLSYSIAEKKFETIFKSDKPNSRLNICFEKNHLIVGEFPLYDLNSPSQILKVNLFNNLGYKTRETLYSNNKADIGNMICKKEKIYFIKTVRLIPELNARETEVASIDKKTKKLTIHSELGDITQLMQMSSYVLAPYRGKYLIVSGNASIIDDSIKRGSQ